MEIRDFDLRPPSNTCFNSRSEIVIYLKSLGLFWWMLLLILPWATVWYFLAIYDLLPDINNFNPALSEFSIIFSLYFYKIINDSWHVYSESIRSYYRILDRSLSIGVHTYSSITYIKEYDSMLIDQTTTDFLVSIRDEINLLTYYVTLLFMPFRRGTLTKPKLERSKMFKTYDVSTREGEGKYTEMCRLCLINIRMWLAEVSNCKYINYANMTSLNKQIDDLMEQISAVESSSYIVEISSIRWHMIVILVIYFTFIIPFKLVSYVKWMIFIVYPFLIFSLIGTIFIVKYIGSPFREINRFPFNPVLTYYDSFIQKNTRYYDEVLNRVVSRMKYHNKHHETSTLESTRQQQHVQRVNKKQHDPYVGNTMDMQALGTAFIVNLAQE